MSNLILTNVCNIQCPFCFASESKPCGENFEEISPTEFWEIVNNFSDGTVRFCGGEPTLHPNFIEFVGSVLSDKKKQCFFMSNGIWPDSVHDFFSKLPSEKLQRTSFLFNTLPPTFYSEEQRKRLDRTLSILPPHLITLGLTIYKTNFEFRYIIDKAIQHKISRIRYSVAAPNVTDPRSWLIDPVEDFPKLAPLVYQLIKDAREAGISVNSDCGYIPPCFFTKEQIADLATNKNFPFHFTCDQAPVDIAKGGKTWRCYGLSQILHTDLQKFQNRSSLAAYYNRRTKLLNQIFLFQECEDCEYRMKKWCGGGCHTFKIVKVLKHFPDATFFPVDDDKAILSCIPVKNPEQYIWQDPQEKRHIFVRKSQSVNEVNFKKDDEENIFSFLEACDGKKSISQMISDWTSNFDSTKEAQEEVVQMARLLFENDVITFQYSFDFPHPSVKQGRSAFRFSIDRSTHPMTLWKNEEQIGNVQGINVSEYGISVFSPVSVDLNGKTFRLLFKEHEISVRGIYQKPILWNDQNGFQVGLAFEDSNDQEKKKDFIREITCRM